MTDSARARILAEAADVPVWFGPLLDSITSGQTDQLMRFQAPAGTKTRESAVLILFGDTEDGPDVLLLERAVDMRSHAGQPAFPGGGLEPEDADLVAAALREAQEETMLDPSGVTVVAELPALWLPPSGHMVTPVVAWWDTPSKIAAGDPREVADVHRVPVVDLVNPANRVIVTHPAGFRGPGFEVAGMLVWGFTAMLLDGLLKLAGWEKPWEDGAPEVPYDAGARPSESLAEVIREEVPE